MEEESFDAKRIGLTVRIPLYTHWFGMFAYDMYKKAALELKGKENVPVDQEVRLANGETRVIASQALENAINKIQSIANMKNRYRSSFNIGFVDKQCEDRKKKETPLFAEAINDFLFPASDGCLDECELGYVRQFPVAGLLF